MSGPAGYPIVIGAVWVALILLLTLAITSARRDRLTAFREAQREWHLGCTLPSGDRTRDFDRPPQA